MWPTSAWLAAGASSAKQWLLTYTSLSYPEAARLEGIAGLCAGHPLLADAVVSGALTLGRADRLSKVVTAEREPFLAEILPALLELAARDGHCVFPSCTRPPRHCDAHHLHHRAHDGPTEVSNGALLCRFHHRLVHEYGWELLVDDTHQDPA